MRKTIAIIAGAGLLLVAGPAAQAGSSKPEKKTVKIYDNYYKPAKVTITAGSTVTWEWPVDVGDSHDVKLTKAPKGAMFTYKDPDTGKTKTSKTFQSAPYAAGPAKFVVKGFTKPGKYHMICTFHSTEMQMDIVVKK